MDKKGSEKIEVKIQLYQDGKIKEQIEGIRLIGVVGRTGRNDNKKREDTMIVHGPWSGTDLIEASYRISKTSDKIIEANERGRGLEEAVKKAFDI